MYLQALAKINKLVMSIHVLLTMADSLKKKKKKKGRTAENSYMEIFYEKQYYLVCKLRSVLFT